MLTAFLLLVSSLALKAINRRTKEKTCYIIMGVMGSGKSLIGAMLAEKIGAAFYDGDDFHSEKSKFKITNGIPLTDEDRTPWLNRLSDLAADANTKKKIVIACSSLKMEYRKILSLKSSKVQFIFLNGPIELIRERLSMRKNHFANPLLLDSQFKTLEIPSEDEAIHISIENEPYEVLEEIISKI